MRKLLLLLCVGIMCLSPDLMAQQRTVNGRVTDASDGTPLANVTVQEKGTANATQTDLQGLYSINVSPGATLIFRSVGFNTVERAIGTTSAIDVSLIASTSDIGEVVVTAMGIQRQERSLGYASQRITAEDLTVNKQTNVVGALQGKTAGVQIRNTGGAPGQGVKIQIRGINSIDPNRDNSPLFVIDGVVMDNSTSTQGSSASGRGMSNRSVDINPDDIASINILRGGAATALYGLRGANGVVVISTKSGQAGALRVTYQGTAGYDEINKYPLVQKKYTQGWGGIYDPTSFWPAFGPTVEEALKIDPTHPATLPDVAREAYQRGNQVRNSLMFSGGTERLTFMSSISQFHQEGVMPTTDFSNLQARLNTTFKPNDKFSVTTNMGVNNSGGDRGNAIRFNEQVSYWVPRYDITNYKKPDGTMHMDYSGLSNNPIYVAETNRFRDDVLRFIGNTSFNYQPLEWLNLNYTFGVDTYRDHRRRWAPGFQGLEGEILLSENGGTGAGGRGFHYVYENKYRTFNSTFMITLSHQLTENLHGTLRLANDIYDRNMYRTAVEGWDLSIWNWFDLRNANQIYAANYTEDYRLMGNFFDATLNFKDYLYLNITGRVDKTSSLLKPYNTFFYPSVNVSYVFSDHFKLPEVIDYAKLRLSYAQVGKDANAYATSYGYGSYTGLPTGYTGFTRSALLGNPLLRPEFTNTYEAGLEMNFFDRRLRFDGNYYHSVSEDQIFQLPISTTTGYGIATTNIGDMRNKGVEITLGGTPIRNSNFTWDTEFNFSANRNMVLSLAGDESDVINVYSESGYLNSAVTMRVVPGKPYGTLYGRAYVRYYTPEEKAAGLDKTTAIDQSRPIVIAANGFPQLEPTSVQKEMGSVLPKWIGGWYNNFSYKNLSVGLLFDGQFGHYAYNQLDNFYASFGLSEYTLNREDHIVFDGVLADGTKNTQEVWLGQGVDAKTGRNYGNGYYRDNFRGNSEYFVQDATWVKLRSVNLSYAIPSNWLGSGFIKNASVGVTGNNLYVWTKFNGFDPESSTTSSGSNVEGFAGFTYPAVRSMLFNLNIGF